MYRLKASDTAGRAATFASETVDRGSVKIWELAGRGFKNILVSDPNGLKMNAAAFERYIDRE